MTELAALSTKLAALAAEDDVFADGGARVISQDGKPAPLEALLQEVDNTVLERTLVFGIGDVALSIVVAGRRLRGIVEVDGDLPGIEAVVGEVLSRDEPDTLEAVGVQLAELCAAAPRITVRSTPVRPIGNSGDAGVSATGLATLWQDRAGSDVSDGSGSLIERFLSTKAEVISGYVHFSDGKIAAESGETADLNDIWNSQVTEFLDRHQKLRGPIDGPLLIGLDHALGPDKAIALAKDGDEACLLVCAPESLPALAASWAKAAT